MKKYLPYLSLLLISQQVYAESVWGTLREFRNSVHEVTGVAKEAGQLSKEMGIGQGSGKGKQQPETGNLQPGDILFSKISNQAVFTEASKKSPTSFRVSKSDELVYMGEESNGFLRVNADKGEGWVEKILTKKN